MSSTSDGRRAVRCDLIDVAGYREHLAIEPIDAIAGRFALHVCSRFAAAREPDALRVRYRATLDRGALLRLHRTLGELLADTPAPGQAEGGRP
jgi:hypothetical protein